ncbi:GDSL-type esterase/lipase family protein [Chitinophaga qingshengii]|uniref:Alpha/beta hydrolase fold domain-containing protein n=1 Tax=Chitinophaga qingshengii TaxID=1569794 RepID=A0ABR7TRE3_9BACT|nr:GDSL-type esterase/lipase family protein [Chitinophaga qingshengii]MBC9933066.1 alpha/beta hydrolase fold domain-containing protein [Chitinophaga qingshengii]
MTIFSTLSRYARCIGLFLVLCIPAAVWAQRYVSLEGAPLTHGNPVEKDNLVHLVRQPLLQLFLSDHQPAKGTVLLFPGGGYEVLDVKREGANTAAFLNKLGYDVAMLEYRIAAGSDTRELALSDALTAYRLLQDKAGKLGLLSKTLSIMGYSAGGHLAARTLQRLPPAQQPANLMLIYPAYLQETLQGSVYPAVLPPPVVKSRLFTVIAADDQREWVNSCIQYGKVWKGYDGKGSYHVLPDGGHGFGMDKNLPGAAAKWPALLQSFLEKPDPAPAAVNSAAVPTAWGNGKRHAQKLLEVAARQYDLIMIGNSITHNLEKPDYQAVWNQFFAPRKALNLGFSGYRTENILWNLENGELKGQSPKVVTLEIGTNNIDEKNYPVRHTAGQLAGGIKAIVQLLRQKLPNTKIILLRCFPGSYDGPNPTSHRMILDRASDMVAKLADNQHVFFCDVNHVFLNLDGTIRHEQMPDWLHPSPAGALDWAKAMEPLLSQLMGDASRDTALPANTAVVPVPKLENDSYDWWARHAEVLRIKDSINPEIVMVGNSITHFWGGYPLLRGTDGQLRKANGPDAWAALYGGHRVLNLGFGWDRTQNVLWRLDHGELDGLHPQTVVLEIGTNNTSQTTNARANTPAEIVEGIAAICGRIRSKAPQAKILLMALFPREQQPDHARRAVIRETNRLLTAFATKEHIRLLDIGPQLTTPEGVLLKEIMYDFVHPTEKGYRIWAEALKQEVF